MVSGNNSQQNGNRRWNYRSMRRSQNHDEAQANGSRKPPAIPEHPLVPGSDPQLINTNQALADFIDHIQSLGSFGYDTEFIGEESYYPQLCLIQLATSQQIAVVDPMADIDITPLWQLIADPSIQTILHSGLQDLEIAVRCMGRKPANIFDTQIAAGFVGYPYPVGLGKLIRQVMNVGLGKAHTFTRWDRRPLTEMQLLYAADDVRYLPVLQQHLEQQLAAAGYQHWASEEFEMTSSHISGEVDLEALCRRVQGSSQLRARNYAILKNLVEFRDQAAREQDMPPRTFLKDGVLKDIARRPPKSETELRQVRGLPRPVVEQYGSTILELVKNAKPVKTQDHKKITAEDDHPLDRMRIDALWATVCSYCMGKRIDPNLVTNRRQIGDFYHTILADGHLDSFTIMHGWRRSFLGEIIIDFCRGQTGIELNFADGELNASTANQSVDQELSS